MVLADAFYFIARLNRRDQFHTRIVEFSYRLEARLVATELIPVEVADALAASSCRNQIRAFIEKVTSSGVLVVPTTSEQLREALNFYHQYADKQWTSTDWVSSLVMRRLSITEALTGDRHFAQAGFKVLFD